MKARQTSGRLRIVDVSGGEVPRVVDPDEIRCWRVDVDAAFTEFPPDERRKPVC